MKEEGEQVLYSVEGARALLVLNRPEKRNALNDAVISGLKEYLRVADEDESIRVIVITGAGADFCSGADLSALQKISQASVMENLEDARSLMELFSLIRRVRVPVVAAVRASSRGFQNSTLTTYVPTRIREVAAPAEAPAAQVDVDAPAGPARLAQGE